jgi:hypothetical protein
MVYTKILALWFCAWHSVMVMNFKDCLKIHIKTVGGVRFLNAPSLTISIRCVQSTNAPYEGSNLNILLLDLTFSGSNYAQK